MSPRTRQSASAALARLIPRQPGAATSDRAQWDWLPRLPHWIDPLSLRVALKTCVGLVVGLSVALWLGWSPTGVAFACIMLQTPYLGRTLGRSVLRIAGAIAGSLLAMTLIATLVQERVALLTAYALLTGLIIYLEQLSEYPYALLFVLLSVGLITFGSIYDPQNAFSEALSWMSGNALGVTIVLFMHGVVWPHTGERSLEKQLRTFLEGLSHLFTLRMAALPQNPTRGPENAAEIRQLESHLIAALTQLRLALGIASRDTGRIARFHVPYAGLVEQLQSLMSVIMAYGENLRVWRDTALAMALVPGSAAPGRIMQALQGQLDDLAAGCARARDGTEAPSGREALQTIEAQIEAFRQTLRTRPHDALEAALFDAASEKAIETSGAITRTHQALASVEQPGKPVASAAPPRSQIDPITRIRSPALRLQKAAIGVVAVSVASLLWIYLDWPMPAALLAFVLMPVALNAMVPKFPIMGALKSLFWGPAIAAVLYFAVMPALDGMWQLAPVLILFLLPSTYLTNSANPSTMMCGMFTSLWVVELIDLSDVQVYSFADFSNHLIGIVGGVGVGLATLAFLNPPVPERQFKTYAREFFSRCERAIRDLRQPKARGSDEITARRAEWLELLCLCEMWTRELHPPRHPESELARLGAFIETMWAIAFRLEALEQARQRHPDETLIATPAERCREASIEELGQLRQSLASSASPARMKLAGAADDFRAALEPLRVAAEDGDRTRDPLRQALTLTGYYCALADAIDDGLRHADEVDWRQWDLGYF